MVLGPTTEASFRQTLMTFKGDLLLILDRPVATVLLAAAVLFLTARILYRMYSGKRQQDAH